jgi:NAD+ synthetase
VLGTGNRDEDFVLGYYTLFGDGAVHISPIGNISKRLVRELARYLGFPDLADRVPTAGLEPGQTDFKDIGYSYDSAEVIIEGLLQGFSPDGLAVHSQVVPLVKRDLAAYARMYGRPKFSSAAEVIEDVARRNRIAKAKAEILHPPAAPLTLRYE